MYKEDVVLIKNFHNLLSHSKSSIKSYKTVFNKYRAFHNMSLNELLEEALLDQENNVPAHKLKLTYRLNSFKDFLIKNHINNTVLSSFSKIKTFYKCNGVYLPYIPPINTNSLRKNDYISFDDLITREELIKIINVADDDFKNWIYFLLSSGSAKSDCFNITNKMFYDASYSYHKQDNFKDALTILSKRDDVVICFKLTRRKTNVPYWAFISPECAKSIANTKLKEKDFNLNNYLLKHNLDWLGRRCRFYNKYFNLGFAGDYVRFRPHMIRKYFSTYLTQGSLDSDELLLVDVVDSLQGRCKSKTHTAYFKDNPNVLKLAYVKCLNNISLFHEYDYEVVDDKVIVYSHKNIN